LIDIEYAIIVDVEATPARTYDEVNRIARGGCPRDAPPDTQPHGAASRPAPQCRGLKFSEFSIACRRGDRVGGLMQCELTTQAKPALGHKRPFASVEPHASFTFTNRHSPEQQVAALRPMLSNAGSLSVFEKFRDGRSRALNSRSA
jgi:hypothetical protein